MSTQVVEPRPSPQTGEHGGRRWWTAASPGWLGVLLGFLALFLAVPPLTIRSPVPTVILGVAAVACGVWAIRNGERKLGLGAIATAIIGVIVGIGATKSGVTNLERVVVW